MFPVENGEPDDRYASKHDIVKLVQNIIVDSSSAKEADPSVHPYWNDVQHVFIEHIRDKICISAICFTTVAEKEVLEHFKLADGVVGGACCLLAFKPTNTDSNMCCSYHTYVICTVSDRKRWFFRWPSLNHSHYVCFLLRTYSTYQNYFSSLHCAKIYKITLKRFICLDSCQLRSVNYYSLLSGSVSTLCNVLIDLLFELVWLATFELHPVLSFVEQLAALANVNRSLNFVSG